MSGGTYAPGSAIAAAAKPPTNHGQIRGILKWAQPDDWTGRWMWNRYQVTYMRNGRPVSIPDLIFIQNYHDYVRRIDAAHEIHEAERYLDAADLPPEQREALLDCYWPDLTPAMRLICAEQIRAREAREAERAAAKAKAPARRPAARTAKRPTATARRRR